MEGGWDDSCRREFAHEDVVDRQGCTYTLNVFCIVATWKRGKRTRVQATEYPSSHAKNQTDRSRLAAGLTEHPWEAHYLASWTSRGEEGWLHIIAFRACRHFVTACSATSLTAVRVFSRTTSIEANQSRLERFSKRSDRQSRSEEH